MRGYTISMYKQILVLNMISNLYHSNHLKFIPICKANKCVNKVTKDLKVA